MSLPKGKHLSEEHRKKISVSQTGHNLSEESRKKISKALTGKHPSEETKKKTSKALKGKPHTKEHIRNSSEAHKGIHYKHKNPRSEEHRRKLSEAQKGEKGHNWKGGITKDKKYQRAWRIVSEHKRKTLKLETGGSFTLGEWKTLKKQYGSKCPACKRKEPEIKLTVDHIIPLSGGGKNCIENIQPLCGPCNSKKHTEVFRITPKGELMLF